MLHLNLLFNTILLISFISSFHEGYGRTIFATEDFPLIEEDYIIEDKANDDISEKLSEANTIRYLLEAREERNKILSRAIEESIDGLINKNQKRGFDSISYLSDFGGFSKRSFDPIEHLTDFGGLTKRGFDSIEHLTDFGGFSKRSGTDARKRGFDSIEYFTDFGGFAKRGGSKMPGVKRGFDSIEHLTDFGGFAKRGEITKRGFDSIEHLTDFGHFGKRGFDSIEHLSDFGRFSKRADEDGVDKRGFDSIEHLTDFGNFAKRAVEAMDDESLLRSSGKAEFGMSLNPKKAVEMLQAFEAGKKKAHHSQGNVKLSRNANNKRSSSSSRLRPRIGDEQLRTLNRLLSML